MTTADRKALGAMVALAELAAGMADDESLPPELCRTLLGSPDDAHELITIGCSRSEDRRVLVWKQACLRCTAVTVTTLDVRTGRRL